MMIWFSVQTKGQRFRMLSFRTPICSCTLAVIIAWHLPTVVISFKKLGLFLVWLIFFFFFLLLLVVFSFVEKLSFVLPW